jgi:hypothetical protein
VEAVQLSVTDVVLRFEELRLDGADGAVVSAGVPPPPPPPPPELSVTTVRALLAAEAFPAASMALTVKAYEVAAVSPEIGALVVVTLATWMVPPRYTRYPVTATLSVEALQARETEVLVTLEEVSPAGALGGVVSGRGGVTTVRALLAAEAFPAASMALTVKEYEVAAVSPEIGALVVVTLATWMVPPR